MGKGRGLKAALQSQQTRLKAKEKISHAAQISDNKQKRQGQASRGKKPATNPPTIPFSPTDRILLVGEGNFSFARALVANPPDQLAWLPPGNVTATAYDSEEECFEKYPESRSITASLRENGVEVIFGVDATRLEKVAPLRGRKWDRIVWNFPHAGKGITDQDRNILSNQVLILGFLRSAAQLLQEGPLPQIGLSKRKKRKLDEDDEDDDEMRHGTVSENEGEDIVRSTNKSRGTVLITLRNVAPYTQWDLPRLAKNPPPPTGSTPPNPLYAQLRSIQFHRSLWKGYEHRMTKGERAHGKGSTGEGGEDRTWEFCIRDIG